MDERKQPDVPPAVQAARVLGAGLSWVASTAVFALGGYWADERLGSSPWLTLTGALVGGSAGFYSLLRQVKSGAAPTKTNIKE